MERKRGLQWGEILFEYRIHERTFVVGHHKSDNLQYNTLGCWIERLIDQVSDGPSIILKDWK